MATQRTRKAPAKKPAEAKPDTNGNGEGARARLAIPHVTTGQKVTHDAVVSPEVLAEHDQADATRRARAREVWGDVDRLSGHLFAQLAPLLREPINPRNVVTTGPAEQGKPFVTTGIQSVQVQIDRLDEVLGHDHFRLIARHTPDGVRCRVHVIVGNDLSWATADPVTFDLVPYTIVGGQLPADAEAIRALLAHSNTVRFADVLAHEDGWGGHKRGTAPADIWKGSFTNAAKLAIARIGPGDHVYRLEFEDDPHQPEQRARRGNGGTQAPAAQQQQAPPVEGAKPTPAQATKLIDDLLAEEGPMQALRRQADEGLKMFSADPVKRWERLGVADTPEKLQDLLDRISGALDQQAFDGTQS